MYNFSQCANDICFIRLDYETFSLSQPALLDPADGDCSTDSLTTTASTNTNPPVICGENAGQHMYVDAGNANTGNIVLSFLLTGTAFERRWRIKTTQIPCNTLSTPPTGCTQYFTGLSNIVKTYNFDGPEPVR